MTGVDGHDRGKPCHYYTACRKAAGNVYGSDRACPCHALLPLSCSFALFCPQNTHHNLACQRFCFAPIAFRDVLLTILVGNEVIAFGWIFAHEV